MIAAKVTKIDRQYPSLYLKAEDGSRFVSEDINLVYSCKRGDVLYIKQAVLVGEVILATETTKTMF